MTGQDPAEATSPTDPDKIHAFAAPRHPQNSGVASPKRVAPGWAAYLADPRTAVLFFLTSAHWYLGGGRKGLQAIRARRVVAAIGGFQPRCCSTSKPPPTMVEPALIDLFRLLGTAERPEVRNAAGRTLARLWRADELIVEEEKAIVRRGFTADWQAQPPLPPSPGHPRFRSRLTSASRFWLKPPEALSPSHLAWSYRIHREPSEPASKSGPKPSRGRPRPRSPSFPKISPPWGRTAWPSTPG